MSLSIAVSVKLFSLGQKSLISKTVYKPLYFVCCCVLWHRAVMCAVVCCWGSVDPSRVCCICCWVLLLQGRSESRLLCVLLSVLLCVLLCALLCVLLRMLLLRSRPESSLLGRSRSLLSVLLGRSRSVECAVGVEKICWVCCLGRKGSVVCAVGAG